MPHNRSSTSLQCYESIFLSYLALLGSMKMFLYIF